MQQLNFGNLSIAKKTGAEESPQRYLWGFFILRNNNSFFGYLMWYASPVSLMRSRNLSRQLFSEPGGGQRFGKG
jgi:hypothetical protein